MIKRTADLIEKIAAGSFLIGLYQGNETALWLGFGAYISSLFLTWLAARRAKWTLMLGSLFLSRPRPLSVFTCIVKVFNKQGKTGAEAPGARVSGREAPNLTSRSFLAILKMNRGRCERPRLWGSPPNLWFEWAMPLPDGRSPLRQGRFV